MMKGKDMKRQIFRVILLMIVFGVLTALVSCSGKDKTSPAKNTKTDEINKATTDTTGTEDAFVVKMPDGSTRSYKYQKSGVKFDFDTEPVTFAGVIFTPPKQWHRIDSNCPRKLTYYYGPLEDDTDSAVVNIYYYGKKSETLSVAEYRERWFDMMTMPDGRDPSTAAIMYDMTIDGMTAHVMTLYGTYNLPVDDSTSGKTIPKEWYRLIGVIVEGPEGNVFLQLTGPNKTAVVMIEGFVPMLKAMKQVRS